MPGGSSRGTLSKCSAQGALGFHFPGGGGGGLYRPPKTWGGGFGKRAQLTGSINQLFRTLAPKALKIFMSIKIGQFFFH